MATFKVKDLMIDVIPDARRRGGGGSTGLCADVGMSTDYTPITPWTPVIMTARLTPRIRRLDKIDAKQLDGRGIERLERDVGRQVVTTAFMQGTAQCTQDMATCDAIPRLSPWANVADLLQPGDLFEIRADLKQTLQAIDQVEERMERRTHEHRDELVERLEGAAESLRR